MNALYRTVHEQVKKNSRNILENKTPFQAPSCVCVCVAVCVCVRVCAQACMHGL